jgi:hypothetical protein
MFLFFAFRAAEPDFGAWNLDSSDMMKDVITGEVIGDMRDKECCCQKKVAAKILR